MKFSLLTYNLLFNQACEDLAESILPDHRPDIICLQEVITSDGVLKKLENSAYKLADYSNSFIKFGNIFGVATLYNSEMFELIDSNAIHLPRSFYEILLIILKWGNKPRTVLHTRFRHKMSDNILSVYNTHLSLYATNTLRLRQLKEIGEDCSKKDEKSPLIITGDFNFPFGRKKLEELMGNLELIEATNTILSTINPKEFYNNLWLWQRLLMKSIFKSEVKNDYIFYKNLKRIKAERITAPFSDHYPILAFFEF